MGKIHQKYLSNVTDITFSQKEVLRSPGGHMKDNVYTYLFSAIFFWGNKSNSDARLDLIRLSQFVMDLWSQFSVDSRPPGSEFHPCDESEKKSMWFFGDLLGAIKR